MTIPLATHSDRLLVEATLQGNRSAYGELICRHRDGVVNVVYRLCGDADLAEEAAQEAFLRAWQKLGSYNPEMAFRNWLYRIAVNLALDALRHTPQMMDIDSEPFEDRLRSEEAMPEEQLLHKERIERVRRAVLGLPEASRVVIVLREYESLTYQEIAGVLNIPLGTVMSRLNYARRQLIEKLKAETAQEVFA